MRKLLTPGQTGGVALTLSVAYLSVLAHQRSREQQSAALRAQALALNQIIDPIPAPLPPTRSEAAAAQRATATEYVKDRWNHEIEGAVRWAQNTDWSEVREGAEDTLERLWARAFGGAPADDASKATTSVEAEAAAAGRKVKEAGAGVADAAKEAYLNSRKKIQSVEEAAENKALEARLRANRDASRAEGALVSAAKDLAGKAKAAVGAVEEKLGASNDGKEVEEVSPVQLALKQRYEKPEAKSAKTVAEALMERYIPLSERDNTVLRGL